MRIIAYRRKAGSELALLRHLSQLRRTESLQRFLKSQPQTYSSERSQAIEGSGRNRRHDRRWTVSLPTTSAS